MVIQRYRSEYSQGQISPHHRRVPGNGASDHLRGLRTRPAFQTDLHAAQRPCIVGADNLFGLEYWVYPEKILKNCTLIAAARSGSGKEALESKRKELVEHFGGEILLMDFPAFDVSSTMIRERIKNGKNVRYMTPDKVIDYIETNGLYV